MVTVRNHGDVIEVENPANRHQKTRLRLVTFIEEGRQGANYQVANSTDVLNRAVGIETGETTGVDNIRVHTQPIREDQMQHFPIGKQLPTLFINRNLYSTPQVNQQQGVLPRMIDGRPTYFLTELQEFKRDDIDHRLSNDVLATIHPEYFSERVVSQTARVSRPETVSGAEIQAQTDLVMGTVGEWASDAPDGGANSSYIGGADFTNQG